MATTQTTKSHRRGARWLLALAVLLATALLAAPAAAQTEDVEPTDEEPTTEEPTAEEPMAEEPMAEEPMGEEDPFAMIEEPTGVEEPTEVGDEPAAIGALGIALKTGVVLPQVATELSTGWGIALEGGYQLSPAGRRLAIFGEVGYTQPKVSRDMLPDPRLDGAYDGEQTQREFTIGVGLRVRFLEAGSAWNAYGLLAGRLYLLKTLTVGSVGMAEFGENTEQSTKFGGHFGLGAERLLGPGAVLLEVGFATSDLPHTITGDVSTGAIIGALGYRLFL